MAAAVLSKNGGNSLLEIGQIAGVDSRIVPALHCREQLPGSAGLNREPLGSPLDGLEAEIVDDVVLEARPQARVAEVRIHERRNADVGIVRPVGGADSVGILVSIVRVAK